MAKIIIKQVESKKDYKTFVQFPNKLYKDNQYYVCPLNFDEINSFNRITNYAYEYCESIEFLAYQEGQVVGRICGVINHVYNQKINRKQLRFNHLDMIDDIEVTKALFNAISKWGIAKGMTEFDGPIGFTDLDRQGMLLEGYDVPGMTITYYNSPYYVKHMEALGFTKDVDWREYKVYMPKEFDPRVTKVSKMLQDRFGFQLIEFKKWVDFEPYVPEFFKVYNEAFAPLHGVVPITEKQVTTYVNTYFKLLNMNFLKILKDKDGQLAGLVALAPSLSQASQKSYGKVLPFGWYHLLRALKHPKVLDMYFIAVLPKYQSLGLNAILMEAICKSAQKFGIEYAETGPELEENEKVQSQWKNFEAPIIRRRRCWIRDIDEFK